MQSVYPYILDALSCRDPQDKCARVAALWQRWRDGELSLDAAAGPWRIADPGRPERPRWVAPRQMPSYKIGSRPGHAALLHAIAHIEFNAINLALDAAWRFRQMPHDFVDDWLRVAMEEASHFVLLAQRLAALGYAYGDFDAHNGLWSMAVATDHDALTRMALVPRVMEARGLDVTPGIQHKLRSLGDVDSVEVLDVIYRDEVGHVRIGNYWFTWLCDAGGLEPHETFLALVRQYDVGALRGPYNHEARLEAGFSPFELKMLEDFDVERRRESAKEAGNAMV